MATRRKLDDALDYGRKLQSVHELQAIGSGAAADDIVSLLDVSEVDADAQPKKITLQQIVDTASIRIDDLDDVTITSVSNGQILTYNSSSGTWVNTTSSSTVAGSNTQIQFNNSGTFGASSDFTWNNSTKLLSVNGKVSFALGTAALPSLYPGTDTNTGIYSPGADQIALATNGTERMRIGSSGTVMIPDTGGFASVAGHTFNVSGYVSHVTNSNSTVMMLNRQDTDGTIIDFRHAAATEGSISVSGATVSYNGAHLSRWSQLPGGDERIEILRGSVLSNIDEMCEWGNEHNEQLNRMKVSDVEGDKNVSGVFQSWDDDDDIYTNDFYCAMTGDFIIRIGAGVTVERGDLLMSAGDGTAKPQDDDIIRSKTLAKVTSTHVTCTYDDGSYCVPCVLMAC